MKKYTIIDIAEIIEKSQMILNHLEFIEQEIERVNFNEEELKNFKDTLKTLRENLKEPIFNENIKSIIYTLTVINKSYDKKYKKLFNEL